MQLPSLSLLLSGVFIAYILHSIYTVSQLFTPPPCKDDQICITSFLSSQPKLALHLFTSTTRRPLESEVTKIHTLADFDYTKEQNVPLTIDVPRKTRQNGTLFLHVVVTPLYLNPDASYNKLIKDYKTVYATTRMSEYAVPQAQTFNLLGEDEDSDGKGKGKSKKPAGQSVAHMRSKMTFTIMTDDVSLPFYNLPIELAKEMKITDNHKFLPLLNYNFLYTRHKDLVKITPKTHTMNITFSYTPISIGKLRLILHIEAAMQNFKELGFTNKDIDEVKGLFADTNLYLLAGTVFISAMHLLFDFLAFKNDISFWRSKNNLAGLSMQTVLWRAFSQAVIFLYLLDEGSSLLVLIPAGIGTIIEFWKTKKILRAELSWSNGLPKVRFNWTKCSSAETKTREIDAESMRYLSYLLYPLVILGAIYSLLYLPHKSWYSWCIHSLVNGVYAFGFLFMLPQLFVNYKLKSVAHLPWRSFMYKAFNTFIDDVFAFIITMPVAHRVACFRDDAVFLVYLYQRWLYPVDKSRIDSSTIEQDPGSVEQSLSKKKS